MSVHNEANADSDELTAHKSGASSTEFWTTMVSLVGSFALLFVFPDNDQMVGIATAIILGSGPVYTIGRSFVKARGDKHRAEMVDSQERTQAHALKAKASVEVARLEASAEIDKAIRQPAIAPVDDHPGGAFVDDDIIELTRNPPT